MPDLKFSERRVNELIITFPPKMESIPVEELGAALTHAGQDGYMLTKAKAITEDRGNQRDPVIVTVGITLTLAKP